MTRGRTLTLLALLAVVQHVPSQAQGGAWTAELGRTVGSSPANNVVPWDPDGPGPLDELFVLNNESSLGVLAGGIPHRCALWNGHEFVRMGDNAPTSTIALLDLDADGPAPLSLCSWDGSESAGGTFRLRTWTGESWQLVLTVPSAQRVRAIAVWDPDGAGGQAPWIVVGGTWSQFAGQPSASLAAWDGTAWRSVGAGLAGDVNDILTWDPDGAGPLTRELYVAGKFATSASTSLALNSIARWDGSSWQPLAGGVLQSTLPGHIHDMSVWDSDGEGPLPERLFVAGALTSAGGTATTGVACWTGTTWQPLEQGLAGVVRVLAPFDPDGPGPLPMALVAGGTFLNVGGMPANGLASWSGSAWTPLGGMLTGFVDITGLGVVRRGSFTEGTYSLIISGNFTSVGALPANGLVEWTGSQWKNFGWGLGGNLGDLKLLTWDDDGVGGTAPKLVAYGYFTQSGSQIVNRIAYWHNGQWLPFGAGSTVEIESATSWDSDGPGGTPPRLVASGRFTSGTTTDREVAMWNGMAWQRLGLFSQANQLSSIVAWDRDGDGPLNEQLAVGGTFTGVDGTPAKGVALYDGDSWTALGPNITFANDVDHLVVWDRDGSGPGLPSLVIGGYLIVGGVHQHAVSEFRDGTLLNISFNSLQNPKALHAWDADGDGPLDADLFLAGAVSYPPNTTIYEGVYKLEGGQWVSFAPLLTPWFGQTPVRALCSWDADGQGPEPSRLVVAGRFANAGTLVARCVASWDGQQWSSFEPSFAPPSSAGPAVSSVVSWDRDGDGPLAPHLVVTPPSNNNGSFAGSTPLGPVAIWDSRPPMVTLVPQPQNVSTGQPFSVSATGSGHGVAFQWLRDGVEVQAGAGGASPGGGTVYGARGFILFASPTVLLIEDSQPSDSGEYSLRLSNPFGQVVTPAALVSVTAPCRPDLTAAAIVGSPGYGVPNGTLNNDDFFFFLTAFASGNAAVADLTASAVPGTPGYGLPNGVINNDDFFYYLTLFAAGC